MSRALRFGSEERVPVEIKAAFEAAALGENMKDIDLTGVDPRRWPEVRRRVTAIKTYIALGSRDGARRDELASQLNISPMTFLTLVKAWREHGQASKLQGSGVRDRGQPRSARSLPKATRGAILQSIDALGVDARHVDLVADVNARCDAVATGRPSAGMVQRFVMQARRDAPARAGAAEILIGRVVAKLPVSCTGGAILPDLLVAVLSPENVIVAHMLDDGTGRRARVDALLADIDGVATFGGDPRPVLAPVGLVETTSPASRPRIVPAPTSARIVRMLGSAIGQLGISHRRKPTTHAPNDGSPMNVPLDHGVATEAVRVAVEAHNAGRGIIPAFAVALPQAHRPIDKRLAVVSRPRTQAQREDSPEPPAPLSH